MTKISNQYSLTNILTADLANSRLGINNVSPAYSLDLTGTARISGVTTFSSNVGVGVVPQTWYSTVSAIQFSSGGALWGIGFSNNIFSANEYLDAAATSKYIGADAASRYQQNAGNHVWSTAGSGTAGSNISFTERMRITSAGNVGIGTTTPSQKLEVNGTIRAAGAFVQATGNLFVGDWTGFYDVSTSTSKVYLLQLVPTETIPLLNYRLFGVIQTNTVSGTYYFTSIASQTMEVRFVGNVIQARITNGNGYYFNWSITQLC